MNLKEKLMEDYPQLNESQINKIIEDSNKKIIKEAEKEIVEGRPAKKPKGLMKSVKEERVREIVRDELNILDKEVPF
jgi:hypothetical protein